MVNVGAVAWAVVPHLSATACAHGAAMMQPASDVTVRSSQLQAATVDNHFGGPRR